MLNKTLQNERKSDQARAADIFYTQQNFIHKRMDKLFAVLLLLEWLATAAAVGFDLFLTNSHPSSKVSERFSLVLIGGIVASFFAAYALKYAGAPLTRYLIAGGQILTAGYFVYLTAGTENQHHIFIFLALLVFYRDWRIFVPSVFFSLIDYCLRVSFYPHLLGESAGKLDFAGAEHLIWIIFESLLLVLLCRYIVNGMWQYAYQAAALEFNEGRYRAVIEQSEEGIVLIEPETMRVIECNESFARLLGYDSAEAVESLTAYDFNADEDWRDRYLIKKKGAQKIYYSGEKNYRRRDGELVRVEGTASLVSYNNSEVYCVNVKDVTERRRAEEKLLSLAIVAQKTQNAVIITDAEGYIKWVNEGFTKLTGYEYDEVIGNLGYILQGEKTDPGMVEAIRTTMWARQPFTGEIYNYTKDGTGFWMSISITPTYDDKGEVQGFVAVQMDITDRKALEEQLREAHSKLEIRVNERTAELLAANWSLQIEVSERKRAETKLDEARHFLRRVIDSVPNLIFVKDDQGRFTLANKSLAEIYGTTTDDIIGKTDADFNKDFDDISQIARDDKHVLENLREKIIHEEKLTDAAGNIHWLQTVKRPFVSSDGESRYVLGIATDLTDRKGLETQLRHSQKMESIGQLAAGVAHEINTPTQYVSDNTQFIRDGFAEVNDILTKCRELIEKLDSDNIDLESVKKVQQQFEESDIEFLSCEIPKAIEQALEGVSRISKIVQSMRNFVHPGTVEMKAADINKAIESTVAVAHNEWKYIADLETVFDESLPPVPCLLDEFNQVILNMIINATHSIADVLGEGTRSKGKITISTTRTDNKWAEIRIADTGTGIPCESQSRIFDPFFTTKEVGKGTGQGLAISHNVIVKRHRGQLTFETESGRGTTFIIRLPLHDDCSAGLAP